MGWDIASRLPVNRNKLFSLTRWRLAGWYAGVMGVVLGIGGLGMYEAIAHAHRISADRELESVADTLHKNLETTLKHPGRLEVMSQQRLPNLCLATDNCLSSAAAPSRSPLSDVYQGAYYIRLLAPSGSLIALAGLRPQGLPSPSKTPSWQFIQDSEGNRYRQISLLLHTQDDLFWGYLQIGRSFKDFEDYLAAVRLIMGLGLPLTMLLVGASSWWLAGRAMRPIYQSYSQIQQFTADAAHELRTPLAAVRATVESVLRLPRLPETEARDTLQVIGRQNQRLTHLVSDLLLLSNLDRQIVKGRRQTCHLQDLVSDIEEELAALSITKNVALTSVFLVDRPLKVIGDEEQLYRLALNVVTNAMHYTPAAGQVVITLERNDNQALIRVRDTGIGIAAEHQTKIFDRFFRVGGDRSRRTGGSGLGLSIAQAIARTHNGGIQVESELGKGSTFTIWLPINP